VWDTICKISGIPYFDEDAPVEAWSNFGCGFFKQKTDCFDTASMSQR
jgi:hypothetical protein